MLGGQTAYRRDIDRHGEPGLGRLLRADWSSSFNFFLPEDWRRGTVILQAEINPGGYVAETNTGNNRTASVEAHFNDYKSVCVEFRPLFTMSELKAAGANQV